MGSWSESLFQFLRKNILHPSLFFFLPRMVMCSQHLLLNVSEFLSGGSSEIIREIGSPVALFYKFRLRYREVNCVVFGRELNTHLLSCLVAPAVLPSQFVYSYFVFVALLYMYAKCPHSAAPRPDRDEELCWHRARSFSKRLTLSYSCSELHVFGWL